MDNTPQLHGGSGLDAAHRGRFVAAPKADHFTRTAWLIGLLWSVAPLAFSQSVDNTRFSGAVSITNKGISTIPTFTLGKPAVVFEMTVGKRRLSFEPQPRFALEGKPWSFLFWWRYKAVQRDRFRLSVGAHPALSFKTSSAETDGGSEEIIVARRFLAGEVNSSYFLAQNLSVGVYYLYSRGLERSTTKNTHFVGLNAGVSRVEIAGGLVVGFSPQVYYLRLDDADGYYITFRFSLRKADWPIYLTSIINKTLHTNIAGSQDLLWNVSLVYVFDI